MDSLPGKLWVALAGVFGMPFGWRAVAESSMNSLTKLSVPLVLTPLLALAALGAEAADETVNGAWQKYELAFTYSGFTTKYSCDGLADKVKQLLRAAGARADLKVTSYACSATAGEPTECPRVRMKFFALVPGSPSEAAAAAKKLKVYGKQLGSDAPHPAAAAAAEMPEAGIGHWRPVKIARGSPRDLALGDCELVEQFRDKLLPHFTVRNIEDQTRCIPNQLSGSSISLQFETLDALPTADTPRK
jgi:hypothetical protein